MKTEHSIMKQIPFLGLMVALSLVLSLYTGCSSKKGSISPNAAADEAGADGLEGALGDKDIVDGGREVGPGGSGPGTVGGGGGGPGGCTDNDSDGRCNSQDN